MVEPRYDDSDWPLFRISMPEAELSEAAFATLVDTMDGLFLRGRRFAVLLDARLAPPLSAKRRQLLGERGDAAYARHPGMMVGFACVMRSPVQRGIFTAIHWLTRRNRHARAFSIVTEAEAWLSSRLRAGETSTAASSPP